MDHRRIAEGLQVGGNRVFADCRLVGAAPVFQLGAEIVFGIGSDQPFRQTVALDQEEPVVVAGGDRLVDGGKDCSGRHDIEQRDAAYPRRMVEHQAMRDAATAVVTDELEPRKSQRRHQLDLIERHRPLGIGGVGDVRWRLTAGTVTAQIAADDGEPLGQPSGDLVPDDMRLRIAVEKQHRRAAAADARMDRRLAGWNVVRRKSLEHP